MPTGNTQHASAGAFFIFHRYPVLTPPRNSLNARHSFERTRAPVQLFKLMSRLIKLRLRCWQRCGIRCKLVFVGCAVSPFELLVLPLEFLDVALPSLHLGVDLDGPQSKLFILESETRTAKYSVSDTHTHTHKSSSLSFPVFQGRAHQEGKFSLFRALYIYDGWYHIILKNR